VLFGLWLSTKNTYARTSDSILELSPISCGVTIFFSKQVGYVDHVDARTWVDTLVTCVRNKDTSVIAVVDMLTVDRLCPTVVVVCKVALDQGNVLGIVVVTNISMTPRNARVLDELKALSGVRLFSTVEKALQYAQSQLHPTIAPYSNSSMMTFSAISNF
jgi:hypothetical protein